MTRTPPTIEDLKKLGMSLLDSAKEQLKDGKSFVPTIILGDAADGTGGTVVGIVGDLLNSNEAKDGIVRKVRELIEEHGYMHSVSLLDTYVLGVHRDDRDAALAMRVLQGMGLSLKEISALGFGKLEERAVSIVEAVGKSVMLSFTYERDPEGNVVKFGEVDDEAAPLSGRFKFFENQPPSEANSRRSR